MFEADSCGILLFTNNQQINQGVDRANPEDQEGMMGYATNETEKHAFGT
jgi:S-adenosylmethionine synthetase